MGERKQECVGCGGVVVWTRWGERRLVKVECGDWRGCGLDEVG